MKHKILKTGLSIITFSCAFANFSTVSAASEQDKIPEIMQPYTVIEYTSNDDFKIIEGGFLSSNELNKVENYLKKSELESQTMLKNRFQDEQINTEYNLTEKISPVKGMEITYASDGLIFSVKYPENVENPLKKESNKQARGPILPPGVNLVRSWGSYPNKLYVDKSSNTIFGIGRATTFNDYKGQGEHILKKGDIATKLAHDNCKLGISVSVISRGSAGKGSDVTKTMKKWDAGGMENAIVDIWKDGVQYWGYTYKKYLSLSGTTSIEHANLDTKGNKLY